jgi:hypothetical protein
VDTQTTRNSITAKLQFSILNNRYDLQVRNRTPDDFRTPTKHLHRPTITINLDFLNPSNNHSEFWKVLLRALLQVFYDQDFLHCNPSVCYSSMNLSCTCYVVTTPNEITCILPNQRVGVMPDPVLSTHLAKAWKTWKTT